MSKLSFFPSNMKNLCISFLLINEFIVIGLEIILEDSARLICMDDAKHKWQLMKAVIFILPNTTERESESSYFLALKFGHKFLSCQPKSVVDCHEIGNLQKLLLLIRQVSSVSCLPPVVASPASCPLPSRVWCMKVEDPDEEFQFPTLTPNPLFHPCSSLRHD